MLKITAQKFAAALGLSCLAPICAPAQDAGALVEALVRKGVLTDQEAEEVRADMTRDFSQTSAGKINLSSSITELKLYGDFRYRFQYDNKQAQVANPENENQRVRHRWRLRLGADINLTEQFYGGFAIETGQASDSGNQVVQDGFDDFNIFMARAYLGWRPNNWLNVTLGKFRNPFYTTDLIWDSDINPQGLLETIAFHKMPAFGGGGEVHRETPWELTLVAGQLIYDENNEFNFDNDASTDAYMFVEQLIATWKFNSDTSITIAPAFYTFTAADLSGFTNENSFSDAPYVGSTTSTRTTTSTVLTTVDTVSANGATTTRVVTPTTVTSTVTTVTNPNGTSSTSTNSRTVRPGAPTTTVLASGGTPNQVTTAADTVASASTATPARPVGNGLPAVSGETRQLHILTAPGDISFKLGGLRSKVYWDFAYNFGGRERFNDIYQLSERYGALGGSVPYRTRDSIAWLVGFQLGETRKRGDWMAYLTYRETGIASIDPNLNDSDFALGELNTRGFKGGVAFAFGEAMVLNITGYLAWNMEKDLRGGRATNAPGVADANSANTVQVDLNIKF